MEGVLAKGLTLWVPVPVQSRNVRHGHWSKAAWAVRRRRTWTAVLARSAMADMGPLIPPAHTPKRVTFTVHVGRLLDPDNVDTKPYLDGLRDAGVIHEDSATSGHDFPPAVQVVDGKWHGVVVRVEIL
jgi:hypothetical protein